jgi:hypothetical protein
MCPVKESRNTNTVPGMRGVFEVRKESMTGRKSLAVNLMEEGPNRRGCTDSDFYGKRENSVEVG